MFLSFMLAVTIVAATPVFLIAAGRRVWASKQPVTVASLFLLTLAVAAAIGFRFGIFNQFQVASGLRIEGLPIPLAFQVLEGDQWTWFVKPRWLTYLCMLANGLFPVALSALIWKIALGRLIRRGFSVAA